MIEYSAKPLRFHWIIQEKHEFDVFIVQLSSTFLSSRSTISLSRKFNRWNIKLRGGVPCGPLTDGICKIRRKWRLGRSMHRWCSGKATGSWPSAQVSLPPGGCSCHSNSHCLQHRTLGSSPWSADRCMIIPDWILKVAKLPFCLPLWPHLNWPKFVLCWQHPN